MSTLTSPRQTSPVTADRPLRTAATLEVLRQIQIVMVRELRPVLRDPFSLVFSLVQPLVFLALFGPLLAGALGASASGADVLDGNVWQWFVPAILVMSTLFGTATTGSALLYEFQTGAHERMLVTPLPRASLLIGRSLKEVVPLTGQAILLIAVMIPFGLQLHLLGAMVGLALLAVFGIGLGAFSNALATAVRNQDWMFWAVHQTVIFPLMILSGMLLPLETGPAWMRAAAAANPLTYVVDAERALFTGDLISSTVIAGWVAALTTAVVGLVVGVRLMTRSAD